MLMELELVEQRYKAVMEVLDGATVLDAARRNGVARQTVHDRLRRYAAHGLAGPADGSSKPQSSPHQCPQRSRPPKAPSDQPAQPMNERRQVPEPMCVVRVGRARQDGHLLRGPSRRAARSLRQSQARFLRTRVTLIFRPGSLT